jgi:hypothetical protein
VERIGVVDESGRLEFATCHRFTTGSFSACTRANADCALQSQNITCFSRGLRSRSKNNQDQS